MSNIDQASSTAYSSGSVAGLKGVKWERQKEMLCKAILEQLNFEVLRKIGPEDLSKTLSSRFHEFVQQKISQEYSDHAEQMAGEICDEIVGLGPLSRFLADEHISEIMVNGPNQVCVEKYGRIMPGNMAFRNEHHLRLVIEQVMIHLDRHIHAKSPMVDGRLPDGSRINVIVPSAAVGGSKITIRRFSKDLINFENLIQMGTMSDDMATFLKSAVEGSPNIIISGRAGAGKTTLLNSLSRFIAPHERIVTIEDAPELSLQQKHVVSLQSVPSSSGGENTVNIRDLLRNALRMRPDRIIVGECRGPEAFDMLKAMNTGMTAQFQLFMPTPPGMP